MAKCLALGQYGNHQIGLNDETNCWEYRWRNRWGVWTGWVPWYHEVTILYGELHSSHFKFMRQDKEKTDAIKFRSLSLK